MWKYEPKIDTWTQAEPIPLPSRRGAASCSIPFYGIIWACGLNDQYTRLNDVSRYTVRGVEQPGFSILHNAEQETLYITGIPHYSSVTILAINGQTMFDTYGQHDHLSVSTKNWSPGAYVVWIGKKSVKFVVG